MKKPYVNHEDGEGNVIRTTQDVAPGVNHYNIGHQVATDGTISCECAKVTANLPKPKEEAVDPPKDPRISPRAAARRRLLQDRFWLEHEAERAWKNLPLEERAK